MIVYFWAFIVFAKNPNSKQTCLQALLVVAAISGVVGAIEQIFNMHPFGYHYLQGTGFLGGPMAYAGQMQIFSLLALAILLVGGYRDFAFSLKRSSIFILIVLANFLGVIFAAERNAWLGLVVGLIVMTAVISWRTLLKCCLVLAVISVVCFMIVPVVHTRITQLENWRQDISVKARLQIWQESLKLWRASPVFGIGIRHYPHFNMPEAIVPGRSKDINHAHSNYLHILSTTGLIGLTAYLWLWFVVFKTSLSCYLKARETGSKIESSLALGILASTVALLVSGIFEYNFGTAQVRLAQWFVLAMLPAATKKQ